MHLLDWSGDIYGDHLRVEMVDRIRDIVPFPSVDALIEAIKGDERDRLKLQILRQLIDETLQLQEAKTAEVTVSNAEVTQAFARAAAASFQTTPQKLPDYLAGVGASSAHGHDRPAGAAPAGVEALDDIVRQHGQGALPLDATAPEGGGQNNG